MLSYFKHYYAEDMWTIIRGILKVYYAILRTVSQSLICIGIRTFGSNLSQCNCYTLHHGKFATPFVISTDRFKGFFLGI